MRVIRGGGRDVAMNPGARACLTGPLDIGEFLALVDEIMGDR